MDAYGPSTSGVKREAYGPSTSSPAKRFKPNDQADYEQMRFRAKHPFAQDPSRTFGPVPNEPYVDAEPYSSYQSPSGPLSKRELRERKRIRKIERKPYGALRVELNHLGTSVITAQKLRQGGKKSRLKDQHWRDRNNFAALLVAKMKGQMRNIVLKSDSTRIMQTAIKYGSPEQRLEIAKELRGKFITLSMEKYAHFAVQGLLEYTNKPRMDPHNTKARDIIVNELTQKITKLISHRIACQVADYAVMVAASPSQKNRALQRFLSLKYYRKPIQEQKEKEGDKAPSFKSLDAILTAESLTKSEKKSMTKKMKQFLEFAFEKEITSTGVFQTILYHYLHHNFDRKKLILHMMQLTVPLVMHLQNVTKGVLAVIDMINYSMWIPNTMRKRLIKTLSPCIVQMSCDKDSYLVVLRVLDVFDDTIVLKKFVVKHILNNLDIFIHDQLARRVLWHLIAPHAQVLTDKDSYLGHEWYSKVCVEPVKLTEQNEKEMKKYDDDDDGDGDDDDSDSDNDSDLEEEEKEDNIPLSGDAIFGRNKKEGIDVEMEKEKKAKAAKMEKAVFLDPRTVPNCKKDWRKKREAVLQMVLPQVVGYCIENIKKVMVEKYVDPTMYPAAFLDALLRVLMSDEMRDLQMKGRDKSMHSGQSLADSLMESIAYVAVVDVSPRTMSPEPQEPAPPTGSGDVEIQNVVEDSMKLVDEQMDGGMNLATVDLTKMDPATARNIMKLQQLEAAKKEETMALIQNAEYEIAMKRYKMSCDRHKEKRKREDMNNGMFWHKRGQWILLSLLKEHEAMRAHLLDALFDEKVVKEDQWWSFLDLTASGVKVIEFVYREANEEAQEKMKRIIKPICKTIKEKYVPDDLGKHSLIRKAFENLCNQLGVC